MQTGRNFKEVMERNNQGKTVRYVIGNCEECSDEYRKKAHGCTYKNLCYNCSQKKGWKKHKGQIHQKSRTGKYKKCKVCEKEFYVKKGRLSTRKYCSWDCYHNWMKENPRTDFMVGKHGICVAKRTHHRGNKRKIKQELIERDGGKECLICGIPGDGLHMHRVVYGSQGGKYETSNCVQLCGDDHALVHSSKKTWLDPLLRYLAEPNHENRSFLINLKTEISKEKEHRMQKRNELIQYYEQSR